MLLITDSENPVVVVKDFDAAILWYKQHTQLTPKKEKDFLSRLKQSFSAVNSIVPFQIGGRYAVQWITCWPECS